MRRLVFFVLGLLFITAQLYAQNKTISGRVADAQGAPVVNASVTVKGSNVGTATDAEGKFSLSVPSDAKTLVISSIGFEPQEVAIKGNSISVSLISTDNSLVEVIVQVPYGTVKKKDFTGSTGVVGAQQIAKQQVTNVTKAIDGLVAGVMTTNGGGAPGSGASIVIRGFASVNGTQSPLYVLNGVPYDGSISSISNDDIESVTILKDAAAASLFGSRAAAGVVMITTKTGKKGKPAVSATVRQGWMVRGIPEYDRVGPQDYYELHWEATRNAFLAQGLTRAQAGINASNQLTDANHLVYNAYNVPGNKLVDSVTGLLNPNAQLLWNESWEDALFHTAARTNANVNISGANDRSNYYVSFGYLSEDGTEMHSNYKRYNIRMNVNTDATNWFTTGANVDAAYVTSTGVINGGSFTSNPFYYSRNMGPIYPVYQHNPTTGDVVLDSTGNPALDWGVPSQMGARPYAANSNLVGSLALDDRSSENLNANANAYGEVKFLKNFSFKTSFALNLFDSYGTTYQNSQFGDAASVQGRLTKTFGRNLSYTLNEVLNWNKKIQGVHNVKALIGHENYQLTQDGMSATKTGFQYPNVIQLNTATVTEGTPSSSIDKNTIESYFFNANYDYKGKYLAQFSARRDGSSRFVDSLRWGNFFSGGLGWVLTEEDFLKNVNWLNFLKLRASYGEVGQDNIPGGLYPYTQWYYGDGFGAFSSVGDPKANPNIRWEKNKKSNIGVDFTMFKQRFQGTIEYFNNTSTDLLFNVPIANSNGGRSSQWQNIGESKNTGIEVTLGYNVIRKKDFDWRVDLNVTHLKNEVTKIPEKQRLAGGIVSGSKKIMEGHSIYDFWLKEFAGVDAATGDALYYKDVLDANGKPNGTRVLTNTYSQASFYYFGSSIPDFNGGVTNAFRYKNIDLSFLLAFSYGGLFYDGNYSGLMTATSYGTALHTDILNRWRNPGDVTNVPKLQNGYTANEGSSNRFLFDGSYLNVKNVTLQYTFGKAMTNKMHVAGLNLFANVDNLHLFTAKKGMDPQRSFNGTSDATYPPFRTYTVGLNLNL